MSGAWKGAGRIDRNQGEVVKALRAAAFEVKITSGAGKGWPDIIVSFWAQRVGPYAVMVEIKDGAKPPSARKLTPDQVRFFRFFRGPAAVVHSAEEALWLCKELRAGNLAALEAIPFRDRLPIGRVGAFGKKPDIVAPGNLPFPPS